MTSQEKVYAVIVDFFNIHGYCPSLQDIMDMCGLKSKLYIRRFLKKLKEIGWIETEEESSSPRAFRVSGGSFFHNQSDISPNIIKLYDKEKNALYEYVLDGETLPKDRYYKVIYAIPVIEDEDEPVIAFNKSGFPKQAIFIGEKEDVCANKLALSYPAYISNVEKVGEAVSEATSEIICVWKFNIKDPGEAVTKMKKNEVIDMASTGKLSARYNSIFSLF